MTLAAILGLCLLLPSWEAANARYLSVTNVSQPTQSQKDQPSDSPSQSSAGAPPTDQQKTQDQSAKSPDQPTAPPCPDNSQSASGTKSGCKSAQSNAAKPKKHHTAQKAVAPASTPATGTPPKTVVRNGSAADPTVDLSPAPGPQEASRAQAYKQLLATTDANLQKISGRQLSPDQQDTVKQIKSYMEQAEGAAKDGDVQRAYNLAVKANLLSAELAGQ